MLRNSLNFAFHFLSVFMTDEQTVQQRRRCGQTATDSEQHAALHNKKSVKYIWEMGAQVFNPSTWETERNGSL